MHALESAQGNVGSTKAPTLSNQVGTWLLLENATKPRRPNEYKDYPTCHRLQVISATRICATHTHLQMEVPKPLLRISAIEGRVPGSTDLPLQKLPYAVLGLIRSRPFPCNHSPPRCRPWTTLHPHLVHRVHLPPPTLILYFSFSPRTPRLLHLLTTLLAPPLPFSFSQSSPLSLLRPPLQIPTPLAPDIFI